ncbi:ABC transporter permease, partial [Porphyromonas loveana]
IGSMVSSDEDTSQFMMPVMIIMMFGFYAAYGSMNNPEGALAFWCSMIPFTSPLVMMVRLPYDVPLWQELLSLGLLYGTFVLMTWIGAKIYRVGVLMYGKKPSVKEIIRWISYK